MDRITRFNWAAAKVLLGSFLILMIFVVLSAIGGYGYTLWDSYQKERRADAQVERDRPQKEAANLKSKIDLRGLGEPR